MIRHSSLGCSLCLILSATAHTDDPQSKTEPKPQWQRMLTGDDAKKATEMKKQIAELEWADKYAEAIRLQGELIALRTKTQGADHWETVKLKWELTALKKVAALAEEKRAGYRKAAQEAAEAQNLEQHAEYAKALPIKLERLKWCREVLGEDHPHTAVSYNIVAYNLNFQAKFTEAERMNQKALEICRRVLGEGHPDTAACYNNLAYDLQSQGNYVQAGALFRNALEIDRKVQGEDHLDTARSYNNVAYNLSRQGKYAEAWTLYQRGLDIRRKLMGDDHPDTAESYNNAAANLNARGNSGEAGPLYQKALDIRRKYFGDDHPHTAESYNNLAASLDAQGKYSEAAPLLQKALGIFSMVLGEDHPLTARSYINVALNLDAQRKYAEATPLYEKALRIHRTVLGESHPYTARSYNAVAGNLIRKGKYAEAATLDQKALDIRRAVLGENHPDTAESYNNVALDLDAQGKYAEAGPLYQKALHIWRRTLGENHPQTVLGYSNAAVNLDRQSKEVEALDTLETNAKCYESARLAIATRGLERASFGAERSPYSFLAAARSRVGRSTDAWAALESDLARGLLDEMSNQRGSGLKPTERRSHDELRGRINPINTRILALATQNRQTDAEAKELEQLIEERKGLEKSLIKLAVEASRREVATLAQLQAALPSDVAFVAWVDVSDKSGGVQEHWGCVVRTAGDPKWERLPGSGAAGKWTIEDTELQVRFREAFIKSAPAFEIDALAKKLRAQRLAPISKHLAGVQRLFVAPVSHMAGIPIDALTDQHTISYTPSGTFLARPKERDRPRSTRVLAVGDPVLPVAKERPQVTALPPGGLLITHVVPKSNAAKSRLQSGDVLVAYAGEDLISVEQLGKLIEVQAGAKSVIVKVWREGQEKMAEREVASGRLGVALAKEPAREAITARRQTDQMLAKLTRGEDYAELPGTQVEIARLAGLFDVKSVTALTRSDATEQRLDEMRKADELKQFKYLHFATHGKANNFRSFDSALILTPPENIPEPRAGEPWLNGRLTAAEVLDYWKLDAELVTLSACESALGRQGGGDGLLGFAQAFLLAGSRSVCLTLWQVDDTATALLMDRFYRNMLGKREDGAKPMGKAAALHEAKQWLRNLSAKDAPERLGTLTEGVVRGERPAREEMKAIPVPKGTGKDYKPYAHPRYWAAFILIGDPE
jgi:tetratricopeptide (TPR) repeat protein